MWGIKASKISPLPCRCGEYRVRTAGFLRLWLSPAVATGLGGIELAREAVATGLGGIELAAPRTGLIPAPRTGLIPIPRSPIPVPG